MDNRNINWLIWNKCSFDRGCLLCFVLSILGLQVGDLLQDQYIGCFDYINETELVTANSNSSDYQLTIEKCISKCGTKTTYAALQNGTTCHCVDDFGIQLPDNACSMVCAGNRSEYCGGATIGNTKSSVHSTVYAVCPVGNYGSACDQFCHCKRQIPCDRVTGNCPDGCDGNYTEPSCNMTLLREQYIGCYEDNSSSSGRFRALTHAPYKWDNGNTLERCRTSCADADFSYAGAQYSSQCFCGESYDKYGELEETKCNSNCPGNKNTFCGGGNANSIYSVCPVGRYGKGCREKCNCLNNTRCIYLNGSCPLSLCKPGWAGSNCNIRYCTAYNGACRQNETCSTVDLKFYRLSVCRCSDGFQRRKIWENCIEIGNRNTENIGSIVGSFLGSMLCLAVIIAVVVILYIYRDKWRMLIQKHHNNQYPEDPATDNKCLQEVELGEREQNSTYYSSSSVLRDINVQQLPSLFRQKISTPGIMDKEFKRVPLEIKKPCNVARNRELKKKNRFRNIVPYDQNRVILRKIDGSPLSDYVNASYIKGYSASDKFIATQGPQSETVGDFWRMVCEKEASVIVMITDLMENRKVKCEKYWPNNGECVEFEGIAVKTTREEYWNDFASRQIQVTKDSQTLLVKQWHFLSWPDHGVPLDANSFRNFHRKVRQSMEAGKYTIVHCSAGAGRTGCFIAIDFLLEQGNAEGKVDIFGCLQSLREQRTQMIQTLDQYKFVHTVLLRYYSIEDTTIQKGVYHEKLRELQQIDPESERCKLDAQFHSLEETKEKLAGISNTRLAMKSIEKNKVVEMDVSFVHGWKKKNAYITLKFPSPTAVQDFYALCRENRCRFVIFLDSLQSSIDPVFPTKESEISLRSHVVSCDRISTADYGTCYKLMERRRSDETYANLEHLAIYANVGGDPDTREMYVFHITEELTRDSIDPHSLIALYKDMRKQTTRGSDGPTVVFTRSGYSLTAFCLAAFIAFDMIKDENEVDIYQISQDIRKAKAQLEFSLTTYKALYATVGQYIDDDICSA